MRLSLFKLIPKFTQLILVLYILEYLVIGENIELDHSLVEYGVSVGVRMAGVTWRRRRQCCHLLARFVSAEVGQWRVKMSTKPEMNRRSKYFTWYENACEYEQLESLKVVTILCFFQLQPLLRRNGRKSRKTTGLRQARFERAMTTTQQGEGKYSC